MDGEGPGHFPVQVREEDHGGTTTAKEGRELGIPTAGGVLREAGMVGMWILITQRQNTVA